MSKFVRKSVCKSVCKSVQTTAEPPSCQAARGHWAVWIVSISTVWPVLVEASKLWSFVLQIEGVAGFLAGAGTTLT